MQPNMITTVFTAVFSLFIFALIVANLLSVRAYVSSIPFYFSAQIAIIFSNTFGLGAYLFITQVRANSIVLTIAGIAGMVIGIMIGGTGKILIYKGRVEIKRSMLTPAFLMLAYTASVFFNMVGGNNLMSLGIVLVIAATAMLVGGVASDTIQGMRINENKPGAVIDSSPKPKRLAI